MKTETEIQQLADDASDLIYKRSSKFKGMTYEEGVRAACEWMINEENENPLE
jgi:hypothetical protein